jgi:hypothetical protein
MCVCVCVCVCVVTTFAMSSVCMLVGDHLLLRDFGPYVMILTNVCVVITVAMALLLRQVAPMSSVCMLVGW